MQVSNVQAGQQFQLQNQNTRVQGSKSEEANEGAAERAAEAQKNAVAQSTGVGSKFDKTV